jgi:serine/threonine protein kinase
MSKNVDITSTSGHNTTPKYKAPELWADPKYEPTFKVDIWASGIIFYECLTGMHPFFAKGQDFWQSVI